MSLHPQRKIIRLQSHDYRSAGAYFVTISTHQRQCLFGEVQDEKMYPNEFGCIVEEEWQRVKVCRGEEVYLDASQVMPNHFHSIIWIYGDESEKIEKRQFANPQAGSLGMIIGDFKAEVTRRIRAIEGEGFEVWQARFHDHIIRNDKSLENIRRYIENNPANWSKDEFHPNVPQQSTNPNGGRYRR